MEGIDISYVTEIPFNSEKLIDIYGSTYKLEELSKYVSGDYMKYIYTSLLISWVLKADPPTGFTLNSDFLVPIKNPFNSDYTKCKFTWYGLSTQPYDLILTKPNTDYTHIANDIFERMRDSYKEVSTKLLNECTSMYIIQSYIDSYSELGELVGG